MIYLQLFFAGLAGLAGVFILIAIGPFEPDEYCECRACCEQFARLEVWLEQPVREACALDDDEQDAWQRITEEAGR